MNLTHKILKAHLLSGEMIPGQEISLRVDQTLTQDATGTMAWLQFEALGLDGVKNELAVSYVDHNTLQMGFRNADDHNFLRTIAARSGAFFSPPGSGICHQLHLENFARPGKILLGSDSHTPNAGGMGSLAMGAGGLSVALAMAGEAYSIAMPEVVQVCLTGQLTGWAQAKDVILALLGRLTTEGGVGRVFEYCGPGVDTLSVPERATITNMGAELGATASIFPSDDNTRDFLRKMGREQEWSYLAADLGSAYDQSVELDLSALEPMAALPHMPDKGMTVAELARQSPPVNQVALGSCTNSSYADLRQVADILHEKHVLPGVDVFVAPGSRQVLSMLADDGSLQKLLDAGVRLLECSCGPCIGMGGSPGSAGVAARTFNRNFEGRSGTRDAMVYLVSPVTAAHCALQGRFTDPASWGDPTAKPEFPLRLPDGRKHFIAPPATGRESVEIFRGPNIVPLERFSGLDAELSGEVLLKVGDGITTDHIMPAGAEITALRSNIPAIARFVFQRTDAEFVNRADQARGAGKAGIIVAGQNYGQGSSREHAALAPRHLGIRVVLAKSFARIHRANLVNFGILPLIFAKPSDYDSLEQGGSLELNLRGLAPGGELSVVAGKGEKIKTVNDLSENELAIIRAGGLLNEVRLHLNLG